MKVQIRLRGIESSPALVAHVRRRVRRHLRRFGADITAVVLRITDQNGPRGGPDKRYQLSVIGPRIGQVHLSEVHDDVHAGVDLALGRVGHAIGRQIERLRELEAHGPAWSDS